MTTADLIKAECLKSRETDPVRLFVSIASMGFIRMHGPEHHILDGSCILTAYKNAGGDIDLSKGLDWICEQGAKMPGAACGYWGVCGAVTSIGAALSFIDGTGPLSRDGSWGKHMMFTSRAVEAIGKVDGPRCCKRDGLIALLTAVDFINENYNVSLGKSDAVCSFSAKNAQCIGSRCPFSKGNS